jgi:O-antigen ligase
MIAVAVAFAPHLRSVLAEAPLAAPLGYANANAALLFQAAIASLLIASIVRLAVVTVAATGAAVGFLAVAILSGSGVVVVLLVGLLPLLAVGVWLGLGRRAPLVLGGLLVAALAASLALGAWYRPGPEQPAPVKAAGRVLTERRLALWQDAWTIMADHPVTGIGPGRFAQESPVALGDRDAVWAHQEFLQLGAEAGAPALLLLLGMFLWALVRLGRAPGWGPAHVIASMGIAALALHASVDYVLHFWEVPVVAAALAAVPVPLRDREAWP